MHGYFKMFSDIQEKSRYKNELLDVRRRLEQAEKDATTSREEGIRLVEKLNAVEREVKTEKHFKAFHLSFFELRYP